MNLIQQENENQMRNTMPMQFLQNVITTFGMLTIAIAAGCGNETASPPVAQTESPVVEQKAADSPSDPKVVAAAAKDALFDKLSTQLLATMSSKGPAEAIEVCSKLAPKLAAEVGEQHNVRIGRTSLKLRNSNNAPPEWAAALLSPELKEPKVVDLPENKSGVLFPIMLKVQCLTCHGPGDKIATEIRDELARLYPNDQATGFQEGDLRGWFWVEVSH